MRSLSALMLAIWIPAILEAAELQSILLPGDSLPNDSEGGVLVAIEAVATNRMGNILVYGRVDTAEEMRSANVWFADSAAGPFEQLNTRNMDISDEDDTRIRLASDGAIVVESWGSAVHRYESLNEPIRIIGDGDHAPGFPEGNTVADPSSFAFNQTYTSISSDIYGGIAGAWIAQSNGLQLVAQIRHGGSRFGGPIGSPGDHRD